MIEAGAIARVPLRDAALCLDCEAIFAVGPEACPACASAQWQPLERFFRERVGVIPLEDVLHQAGNGLTPARIRAELLAQTLELYVNTRLSRWPELLQLAVRRARETVEAIDATMARLRGLDAPERSEPSRSGR